MCALCIFNAGGGIPGTDGFGKLDPVLEHAGSAWEAEVERGLQTPIPSGRPALQQLCSGTGAPLLKDVIKAAIESWRGSPSTAFYAREVALNDVRVPGLGVGLNGRMDFLIIKYKPAPQTPATSRHPWLGGPGSITLRVVECKASRTPKVSHMQQVALYGLMLKAALANAAVAVHGLLEPQLIEQCTAIELVLAVSGESGKGAFTPDPRAANPPTATPTALGRLPIQYGVNMCVDVADVPALEESLTQPHVDDMLALLSEDACLAKTLAQPKTVRQHGVPCSSKLRTTRLHSAGTECCPCHHYTCNNNTRNICRQVLHMRICLQ